MHPKINLKEDEEDKEEEKEKRPVRDKQPNSKFKELELDETGKKYKW